MIQSESSWIFSSLSVFHLRKWLGIRFLLLPSEVKFSISGRSRTKHSVTNASKGTIVRPWNGLSCSSLFAHLLYHIPSRLYTEPRLMLMLSMWRWWRIRHWRMCFPESTASSQVLRETTEGQQNYTSVFVCSPFSPNASWAINPADLWETSKDPRS